MATYTDNYNLIKPTYAETADIVPLNNNFEKIDEVMHASQTSLAPAYDQTASYQPGDVVMYELNMYKCTGATSGTWDPSKWTRTTAAETGGGGGADLDIYGEASGTAEASFSDGAEASLVECEVTIVPNQDLHGYSKPWAGGAGKNKLNVETGSTVLNGVTFTVNADKSVSLSGISEVTFSRPLITTSLSFDYDTLLSCGYDNAGAGTVDIQLNSSQLTLGGDISIPANTAISTIAIRIANGFDTTGITLYPMIRATGQTNVFEPYSNICPISGHTDVTVTVASTSGGSGEDTTVALGRTVYSGTLDVTGGILTVNKVSVDLGTLNWSQLTTNVTGKYRFATGDVASAIKTPPTLQTIADIISSAYEAIQGDQPVQCIQGIAVHTNGNIIIYDSTKDTLSASDFKTAVSGITAVYELATPQTYNLTPTQVETLLGQNYVSHDGGGTISLVYVKGDAPIKPNPTGADIPLTGIEIDGEKFKIESTKQIDVLYENSNGAPFTTTLPLTHNFRDYDIIYIKISDANDITNLGIYNHVSFMPMMVGISGEKISVQALYGDRVTDILFEGATFNVVRASGDVNYLNTVYQIVGIKL